MAKNKIVAVSGGFDPVHEGHIRYFKAAKQLAGKGGQVVLILNSEEFLQKKKGFSFYGSYNERKKILESIKYIDKVIRCVDIDQTVCKTLELLKPDIFAKGGDRTLKNIPERKICKKIGIEMKFGIGGGKIQSSSWLLEKVKNKI